MYLRLLGPVGLGPNHDTRSIHRPRAIVDWRVGAAPPLDLLTGRTLLLQGRRLRLRHCRNLHCRYNWTTLPPLDLSLMTHCGFLPLAMLHASAVPPCLALGRRKGEEKGDRGVEGWRQWRAATEEWMDGVGGEDAQEGEMGRREMNYSG